MFDTDRQFSAATRHQVVASESTKLSQQQICRDVFDHHRHRVFAVGYYMTASEVEAEDILTGTFVTAFSRQTTPDGATVDRALIGELEKRFALVAQPAAQPEATVLSRTSARRTDLEEAVGKLPALERLVFLLRDVEGYSPAKIAALVELSELEVQRTLLSARIRMRNTLANGAARDSG